MTATILDGTQLAEGIRHEVRQQVAEWSAQGRSIKLAALLVGQPPASLVYARSQAALCERMGIDYELVQLPEDTNEAGIIRCLSELNNNPSVTGIMLHMPLPQGIHAPTIQYHIDPYKDVEGVNPANIGLVFYGQPIIAPCTALAVVEIVRQTEMTLRGAHAIIVGQGAIVGRPISVFLIQQDATITACNEFTPNLREHTRKADLLVVAAGKAGLITANHVKPGAVVIDVGINRITTTDDAGQKVTRTVGDVDFESVRDVASAITPVPGGVGPVTVTMLLRNTVEAARKQRARNP